METNDDDITIYLYVVNMFYEYENYFLMFCSFFFIKNCFRIDFGMVFEMIRNGMKTLTKAF